MTRRAWLLLGGAGLAAVGGTWARRRPTTPLVTPVATRLPDLGIDAGDLNFGTTWETDRFVRAVTIHNRTDQPRTVRSLSGSCTCLTIAPGSFTLPPGGRQAVRLTFDLHSQLSRSDPRAEEEFASSFWATVVGQERPTYWRVRGRVRRTLQTPDRIDLGAVSDRTPAAAAATVAVRSLAGELAELRAERAAPWVEVSVRTGARADLFGLAVTPVAGLERRAYTASVVLTPVLRSGEVLPPVSVPVAFEVGPEVQAVPGAVQLGGRAVGTDVRDVVALRAVGGRPFRVRGVRASDPGLTARKLDADGLTVYELTRSVGAAGVFEDRLTFDIDAAGESFELVVPVRGYGYVGV